MPEQLTPSACFFRLLESWSEEDFGASVTPEVRITALPNSDKEVFIADIVSSTDGQGYESEALQKLGQLADAAHCRLVVFVDTQEVSWYGQHGFVWYRGNSKNVLVRRPQAGTA
ncbi:hypothetical protein [Hymenobacter edaphi]|uniref:N-acetyltransferase domain-containing protein n=1 Tax=Hymenobacter edaphi TaxID=2211146 RepID=A0A328BTP8_9BACT|nr:hypothetical protein [Hymenobacter edaphi]RAK69901.1 hypothetical protein DLM85_03330 [Hymenobacter edaphi]